MHYFCFLTPDHEKLVGPPCVGTPDGRLLRFHAQRQQPCVKARNDGIGASLARLRAVGFHGHSRWMEPLDYILRRPFGERALLDYSSGGWHHRATHLRVTCFPVDGTTGLHNSGLHASRWMAPPGYPSPGYMLPGGWNPVS